MASEYVQITPIDPNVEYYDLGAYSCKISTQSSATQIWFDRGINWAYAFNHGEAAVCFRQAIAHDPGCAMAYWGLAFVIGPNYNKKWAAFDKKDLQHSIKASYHITQVAQAHMSSALPWEQALVKAIQARFPSQVVSSDDDFSARDLAYASEMRRVYHQFGAENLDVITLCADALMNTHPWDLFEIATGKPKTGSPALEVKAILDHGLKLPQAKNHPGISHMYIHLMEMSDTPEAALVAADRLRNMVPDAGHMHHMPSHLDVLIGDYRRAVDTNMKATLADDKFYRREGGENFYSLYRLHNYQSLIYAAMLAGQSQIALESVDRMEATITEELLRIDSPPMIDWLEFFKSVRAHVLIRFGLWEEIKKLPIPDDKDFYCVTVAMTHYAKGIAWAATGNVTEADKERSLFQDSSKRVPPTRMDFPNRIVDVLKVAAAMLDGEIEYRRGNYEVAFAKLREAVYHDDHLLYSEPWSWMVPARHPYAALLLEQGHVAEAATVYAEDLGLDGSLVRGHQHPNNVWSLSGYHECLLRLGRKAEAIMIEKQLKTAAAVADVPVKSSCFCKTGDPKECSRGI
ncbi:hypothetical protein N7449_011364 [Penicillium cf. viridicatum]|uniref:TPR domain protein n=1 Tax=Penicillium cf. viridicatum TaxID=2972119 RepID=A0A9W9J1C2_9EURO|nr:hypothetical protein N7449_011364 [Penicillium cf. viridicatum]